MTDPPYELAGFIVRILVRIEFIIAIYAFVRLSSGTRRRG